MNTLTLVVVLFACRFQIFCVIFQSIIIATRKLLLKGLTRYITLHSQGVEFLYYRVLKYDMHVFIPFIEFR